jgi:hypothetical protein
LPWSHPPPTTLTSFYNIQKQILNRPK